MWKNGNSKLTKTPIKFNEECFKLLNSVKLYSEHNRSMIYIKTSESSCSQCINTELDIILKVKKKYVSSFFIITSNDTGVNDLYYQYLLKLKSPVFEVFCREKFEKDSCQVGYMKDSILRPIFTFHSSNSNDILDNITHKIDSIFMQSNN